jgi:hypothetical protein
VHDWAGFGLWEERHRELVREAENRRLVREARKARVEKRSGREPAGPAKGIEVRWGLLEDEGRIADVLELNGMPRWIAFEERYIVAEKDGEILAALRYRTESKRLLLGLLVSDPWAEERPLAVALYAGARELAREMGVGEVIARLSSQARGRIPSAGAPRVEAGCGGGPREPQRASRGRLAQGVRFAWNPCRAFLRGFLG